MSVSHLARDIQRQSYARGGLHLHNYSSHQYQAFLKTSSWEIIVTRILVIRISCDCKVDIHCDTSSTNGS